jgi:hypothetical protein
MTEYIPRLADYGAKDLVVVDAVSGSDRSPAVAERIPGERDVRRKIIGIQLIDIFPVAQQTVQDPNPGLCR